MTRRLIGLSIMILLLCGASAFALQDKISPLSDYMYKRDFPRYEEIKKETDPQKLAGLLIEFLKDRPINKLLPYILPDYQGVLIGYLGKDEWDKAISAAKEMLDVLPTDKAIEEEEIPVGVEEFMQQLQQVRQAMQRISQAAEFSSSYSSGNLARAAELQEQINAASPSIEGVQILADIYLRMENYDKYLENAKKLMAEFPITQPQGFAVAYDSLQVYRQKKDVPAITDISKKLMDVYGEKLPEGFPAAEWNQERAIAYMMFAQEPYAAKDYPKALELFEKVVKADPSDGDAWYLIGMCKWQIEGQAGAVVPFAKSVVTNKAQSARARQYLEQIHDTLVKQEKDPGSIDEILAKAKADLGI